MVGPHIQATAEGVRRCVEEYGSMVHLADALGVSADLVRARIAGDGLPTPQQYAAMFDLVARPPR